MKTILSCRFVLLSVLIGVFVQVQMPALATAQEKVYQAAVAVGNNMNHVPSFVGVEKGIFLKHGIDLKLKVLATGQEMTKAVQAGEAQFLGAAYSNFPLAVERGFKGKGIVGLMGDRTGKYSDEHDVHRHPERDRHHQGPGPGGEESGDGHRGRRA